MIGCVDITGRKGQHVYESSVHFHIWSMQLSIWTVFILCYAIGVVTQSAKIDYQAELEDTRLGEKYGLNTDTKGISADNLAKIIKGAENGDKYNLYFLGLLKLYGINLKKNPKEASQHILGAAQLGHVDAMTAYGVIYYLGMGVNTDYELAIKWLRKGIAAGDVNANWFLGKMMLDGAGFDPSTHDVEAATHFQLAAENGVPQALHHLGLMYEYGKGVIQNFNIAHEYYKRAIEQGYIESMYNVGLMCMEGRGVERDMQKALAMFEAAAREDHAPATYMMGVMRVQGYGYTPVLPNYEQALNWFERAAIMGDERVSKTAKEAANQINEFLNEGKIKCFRQHFLNPLIADLILFTCILFLAVKL